MHLENLKSKLKGQKVVKVLNPVKGKRQILDNLRGRIEGFVNHPITSEILITLKEEIADPTLERWAIFSLNDLPPIKLVVRRLAILAPSNEVISKILRVEKILPGEKNIIFTQGNSTDLYDIYSTRLLKNRWEMTSSFGTKPLPSEKKGPKYSPEIKKILTEEEKIIYETVFPWKASHINILQEQIAFFKGSEVRIAAGSIIRFLHLNLVWSSDHYPKELEKTVISAGEKIFKEIGEKEEIIENFPLLINLFKEIETLTIKKTPMSFRTLTQKLKRIVRTEEELKLNNGVGGVSRRRSRLVSLLRNLKN